MDNLVAQGKEPFVTVSMNYQDWNQQFARIQPDVLNNVLPFVESNYNVSQEREGRAYAGLSAGGRTTALFYLNNPDTFSQFGICSFGVVPTAEQLERIAQHKDSTSVHIALGTWDYVTSGRAMSDTLTANDIPHACNEIPGGHDWQFWQLMLAEFAADHLWVEDRPFAEVGAGYLAQVDAFVAQGRLDRGAGARLHAAVERVLRHQEAGRSVQTSKELDRLAETIARQERHVADADAWTLPTEDGDELVRAGREELEQG